MIFYKNLKPHKDVKNKTLVFSLFDEGVKTKDDSVSKPNLCKKVFNFDFQSGALLPGLGIRELQIPTNISTMAGMHPIVISSFTPTNLIQDRWYNADNGTYHQKIMIVGDDHCVYAVPIPDIFDGVPGLLANRLTSQPSCVCNYRIGDEDGTLYFAKNGALFLSYNQNLLFTDVPEMVSCVVHYNRFFGILKNERNKLIYTTKTNLQQWTTGEQTQVVEFLDDKGLFTKLVKFNDYVYLFMEYGITKISVYSASNDFSYTHLYLSSTRIFENSIQVCGDKIVFATNEGLYAFNGNSVTKILSDYDVYFKDLENKNCTSASFDGKYYLASKLKSEDDGICTNNVLFEIDINAKNVNICKGVDIKKMAVLQTDVMRGVLVLFNDLNSLKIGEITHDGNLFSDSLKKSWTSFETDLGQEAKRKHIKKIFLQTSTECKVKIKSDEDEKEYDFSGDSKIQELPVNICGNLFQFIFETESENCKICKPVIGFDVL